MKKPKNINPLSIGVGLKASHYDEALRGDHWLDFFEVHAENFMGAGGPPKKWLHAFAEKFPLSIHGVCLSVGGRDPIDADHLERLANLVEEFRPALVSEHLAWSAHHGAFFNDLLPPPLTEETLNRTCDHVDLIQERLKQRILIENPSQYLKWAESDIPEYEFLNALVRRTRCGLLLDVNNIYVSVSNIGGDADEYIENISASAVGEIHLAGHAIDCFDNIMIRVDNHGSPVCDEVLALFEKFIRRAGPRPTLIEWDTKTPAFEVLADEARRALLVMERATSESGAHEARR